MTSLSQHLSWRKPYRNSSCVTDGGSGRFVVYTHVVRGVKRLHKRMSNESVAQECPTKVVCKSFTQSEICNLLCVRVRGLRMSQILVDWTCLATGSLVPFVGTP